jgi:hypothetical protein
VRVRVARADVRWLLVARSLAQPFACLPIAQPPWTGLEMRPLFRLRCVLRSEGCRRVVYVRCRGRSGDVVGSSGAVDSDDAAEVTSSTRAPGRWTETRARAEDSLWLTADWRFVASNARRPTTRKR